MAGFPRSRFWYSFGTSASLARSRRQRKQTKGHKHEFTNCRAASRGARGSPPDYHFGCGPPDCWRAEYLDVETFLHPHEKVRDHTSSYEGSSGPPAGGRQAEPTRSRVWCPTNSIPDQSRVSPSGPRAGGLCSTATAGQPRTGENPLRSPRRLGRRCAIRPIPSRSKADLDVLGTAPHPRLPGG